MDGKTRRHWREVALCRQAESCPCERKARWKATTIPQVPAVQSTPFQSKHRTLSLRLRPCVLRGRYVVLALGGEIVTKRRKVSVDPLMTASSATSWLPT